MKLTLSDIAIILATHMAFIRLSYGIDYDIVRYACLTMIGVFMLFCFKHVGSLVLDTSVLLQAAGIVISSALTHDQHLTVRGILYAAELVVLYWLYKYCASRGRLVNALDITRMVIMIYLIIGDLAMLAVPGYFQETQRYLLGDKFTTTYMHLIVYALYLQKRRFVRPSCRGISIGSFAYFLWALLAGIYTNCNTGVIGVLVMALMMALPEKARRFVCRPEVAIATLLASDSLLLIATGLTSGKLMKYIIETVLHRDSGLTGRSSIYSNLVPGLVHARWIIWGTGYGNSYAFLSESIGATDAQNGLLNTLVNVGVVGTVLLIGLIYMSLRSSSSRMEYYALTALIYAYIVMSSVEVCLNFTFVALLLLVAVSKYNQHALVPRTWPKETGGFPLCYRGDSRNLTFVGPH